MGLFAIIIMLMATACSSIAPVALPVQVPATITPVNTLAQPAPTQFPTNTASPTATATPQPTPTEVATNTATAQPIATETPAGMQVFREIPYTQAKGVDPDLLSLDIYSPAAQGPHPVIVMIHGGSWRGGDKNTTVVSGTKSEFFTANGFVFISINYQLAPQAIFPVQEQNVAAALAWVTQHISDYGGNPGELYLMGHSSGGQMAAAVATDERYLTAYQLTPGMLSGVILLDAAGLDIPATMSKSLSFTYTTAFGENPHTWAVASPVTHVAANKGIPPFLVTYTFQVAPFTLGSEEFASELEQAGVTTWSYAAADKTHDSITDDVGTPDDAVTEMIMMFLNATLPRPEGERRMEWE